jgi:NADPH:quinone reductase-like Zn-dependent oxidoreductase
MKAAVRSTYGGPEVLSVREVETPAPGDNELLIRVHASTVNRTDCGVLWGKPFIFRFFTGLFKPSFISPGTDFAGIVEAVGKNVTKFRTGDKVWGFRDTGLGSHAQYMTFAEDGPVILIPEGISYEEAAASAEGPHYALNFINKVKLKKGDQVLVNGASGGIGSAAVQLLKHFGAHVTAVCNTPNLERVRKLGADRVIDYLEEDFTKDQHKYLFVFDAVGKSNFGKCKHLLEPDGVYISSELGPGGENIYLPLITRIRGGKRVIFPFPSNPKRTLELMNTLFESNRYHPLIDRTYPLEKIAEAYTYVNSGQKTGNVMLSFKDQ